MEDLSLIVPTMPFMHTHTDTHIHAPQLRCLPAVETPRLPPTEVAGDQVGFSGPAFVQRPTSEGVLGCWRDLGKSVHHVSYGAWQLKVLTWAC